VQAALKSRGRRNGKKRISIKLSRLVPCKQLCCPQQAVISISSKTWNRYACPVHPQVRDNLNLHPQNAISAAIKASKKADPSETEKGVPLAPSAKDLNPWYSEKLKERQTDEGEIDDRRCLSFVNSLGVISSYGFIETVTQHGNPYMTP
jgi:hypothetical protein